MALYMIHTLVMVPPVASMGSAITMRSSAVSLAGSLLRYDLACTQARQTDGAIKAWTTLVTDQQASVQIACLAWHARARKIQQHQQCLATNA